MAFDFTDNASDTWGCEIQETESIFSAGGTLMSPVVPEEEAPQPCHTAIGGNSDAINSRDSDNDQGCHIYGQ